jgi:hypothetical protein
LMSVRDGASGAEDSPAASAADESARANKALTRGTRRACIFMTILQVSDSRK